MGSFRNLLEPGAIILAFTIGALINRRTARQAPGTPQSRDGSPTLSRSLSPDSRRPSFIPDTVRFRRNITSRFLSRFPFLLEIWYWNLAYWIYQLSRALTAVLIRGDERITSVAKHHALQILFFESRFKIAIELPIQRYILNHAPWLMSILAEIYYSHILVGVIFIVYTYTYLPHTKFTAIRRTIALNNLISFLVLTVWRCMPPRLLPATYGFKDVLHPPQSTPSAPDWDHNPYQLTIAAMPSLHFGTSLFLAWCLVRYSPHRLLRWAAPLWPMAMLLTILATANHFLVDAIVGAMVPVLGWEWNEIILILRPLEEWGFWLIRTERPAFREEDWLEEEDGAKIV